MTGAPAIAMTGKKAIEIVGKDAIEVIGRKADAFNVPETPPIPPYTNTSYLSIGSAANAGHFETDSLNMSPSESFSYSYWIKVPNISTSYTNALYTTIHDGTRDQYNRLEPFQHQFRGNSSNYIALGGSYIKFSSNYDTGNWVHIVVTWSNANVTSSTSITSSLLLSNTTLYINGAWSQLHSPAGTASLTGASLLDKFRIGDAVTSYIEPSFSISDIAIWKGTELSSTQVSEIYGTGTPDNIRAIANMPTPTRYYLFEDATDPNYEEISQSSLGTSSNGTITSY